MIWKKNFFWIFSKGPVVFGYVKTTQKQLYLRDDQGQSFIHTPLCIMDFYIVESAQKHGHGLQLFNFVLEVESPFFLHKLIVVFRTKKWVLLNVHLTIHQNRFCHFLQSTTVWKTQFGNRSVLLFLNSFSRIWNLKLKPPVFPQNSTAEHHLVVLHLAKSQLYLRT